MVLTIIIAFLSLLILVTLHELGHFFVAKKFGVKVEEFGIGIPPRLFGKKIGQTIYSINLLPLGAFVRMYGEDGKSTRTPRKKGSYEQDIEEGHSFTGKPIWQRALIVLAGVVAFWVVAAILFSIAFVIGVEAPVTDEINEGLINPRVRITYIAPESPAEIAGLKVGDTIFELKSQDAILRIDKTAQVQEFTDIYKGKEIILTIQRDKDFFDAFLTPRISPPENEGPIGIGMERMADIIEKHSWYRAPVAGIFYCGELTLKAVKGLGSFFGGLILGKGLPPEAEVSGPLGIIVWMARAFDLGPGFFIYFIGVIAVFVALFNILPIPALDGGKLLFLAIEKIRGKAVSPKVEQNIALVFFVLLITLVVFVTIKFDIPRFSEFLESGF